MLLLPSLAFGPAARAEVTQQHDGPAGSAPATISLDAERQDEGGGVTPMHPTQTQAIVFPPINLSQVAEQQAFAPQQAEPTEIRPIHPPGQDPRGDKPAPEGSMDAAMSASVEREGEPSPQLPAPAANGSSPAPAKTFLGHTMNNSGIPPDTMGAVGPNHIFTATNDRIRIHDRDGVPQLTMTVDAFWASALLGGNPPSTFDPKVYYDRFNARWIFVITANAQSQFSATLVAVSATNDPTGTWYRYALLASDAGAPANTATTGRWADYPSVGHNKKWITIQINMFGWGTGGAAYRGPALYVIDKLAAYAGPGALPVSTFFEGTTCATNANLGCGFTIVPSIAEDNTSETMYLAENWNATSAILRLGKLTGTAAAPVYTGVIQHPQAPNSWRTNAAIIGTSGGYMPQRQLLAYAPSSGRIMANDARIQSVVLRNNRLWAVHHVMVGAAPNPPGVTVGTAANPDIRTAVQWWEINHTLEPGIVIVPALQAGRIVDPTADNCHNGAGGTRTTGLCTSTAQQVGQFFSFPTLAVNQNNDVLIGFSMLSAFTYPNAGYAFRADSDPPNTTRDPVVFRAGQSNYELAATGPQRRWGDYSATMVDPVNDTDFWTTQEYSETARDWGIGLRSPWSTYWTLVKPNAPQPTTTGTLRISEFRLRGPAGPNDEFIELFNPGTAPLRITTADNSEGWAVGFDNGTTQPQLAVIPVGTVIPAGGRYLVARNAVQAGIPPAQAYSLTGYPNVPSRGSDSDGTYHIDIPDNQGVALFRTAIRANFSVATRVDAVGFASLPVGSLFREGAGLPDGPVTGLEFTFFRRLPGGCTGSMGGPGDNCNSLANVQTWIAPTSSYPQDSDDNVNDFLFADTAGTTTTAGTRLGAPGPQNLSSPVVNDARRIDGNPIAPCVGATAAPNRVRNTASYDDTLTPSGPTGPGSPYTLGYLDVRRSFTNFTGAPVTRLRFRIVDITTFPALATVAPATCSGATCVADMRAITSPDSSFVTPCGVSVDVKGTTLEQPPTQGIGGGFNASLSSNTITLATPLAHGARIDINWRLGVVQNGKFRFFVTVEALP